MLFLTDWFPASLCRNVLPPALPLTTCPGYTHGEYNCCVFPKCHIKPARLKGFVELSENILLRASTALHFSWDYSVFVSATKHTQKGLINLLNKRQRSYSHKLQQKKTKPLASGTQVQASETLSSQELQAQWTWPSYITGWGSHPKAQIIPQDFWVMYSIPFKPQSHSRGRGSFSCRCFWFYGRGGLGWKNTFPGRAAQGSGGAPAPGGI